MAASDSRKSNLSNFDKILAQVQVQYRTATRSDVEFALQQVRAREGSFQGMKKSQIISLVLDEISRLGYSEQCNSTPPGDEFAAKEYTSMEVNGESHCNVVSDGINSKMDENSNYSTCSPTNHIENENYTSKSAFCENEKSSQFFDTLHTSCDTNINEQESSTSNSDQATAGTCPVQSKPVPVDETTCGLPPRNKTNKPYNRVAPRKFEINAQSTLNEIVPPTSDWEEITRKSDQLSVDTNLQSNFHTSLLPGQQNCHENPPETSEMIFDTRVLIKDIVEMIVKRNSDLSVGYWEVLSVIRELYSINGRSFDSAELDSEVLIRAAEKLIRHNRGFREKISEVSELNSSNSIKSIPQCSVFSHPDDVHMSERSSRSHSISSSSEMQYTAARNMEIQFSGNGVVKTQEFGLRSDSDNVTTHSTVSIDGDVRRPPSVTQMSSRVPTRTIDCDKVSIVSPDYDSWESRYVSPSTSNCDTTSDFGPPPGFSDNNTPTVPPSATQPTLTVIDKFNRVNSASSDALTNTDILPVLKNRRQQPDTATRDRCKLCADSLIRGSGPKELLSCGHTYHSSCLRNKPTNCPNNCRQDQPTTSKKQGKSSARNSSPANIQQSVPVKNAWKQIAVPSTFDGDAETSCAICFEALNFGNPLTLVCKHRFHEYCMRNWFAKGKERSCPICRKLAILPQEFPSLTEDS